MANLRDFYLNMAQQSAAPVSAPAAYQPLSVRPGPTAPQPQSFFDGTVEAVDDADTVTVRDATGTKRKVRLNNIDAQETGHGRNDPGQPLGMAQRDALVNRVLNKQVRVGLHGADKYGRSLGTLYDGDTDINQELIATGNATTTSTSPQGYMDAQRQAERNGAAAHQRAGYQNPGAFRHLVKGALADPIAEQGRFDTLGDFAVTRSARQSLHSTLGGTKALLADAADTIGLDGSSLRESAKQSLRYASGMSRESDENYNLFNGGTAIGKDVGSALGSGGQVAAAGGGVTAGMRLLGARFPALRALAVPAGVAAGRAASFAMNAGETASNAVMDDKVMASTTPGDRLAHAAGAGAVQTAIELPFGIEGKMLNAVTGKAKHLLGTEARQAGEGFLSAAARRAGAGMGKAMVGEGLEEGAQNIVGQVAMNSLRDKPLDEINWKEVGKDALSGAVGGGVLGAAHNPFSKQAAAPAPAPAAAPGTALGAGQDTAPGVAGIPSLDEIRAEQARRAAAQDGTAQRGADTPAGATSLAPLTPEQDDTLQQHATVLDTLVQQGRITPEHAQESLAEMRATAQKTSVYDRPAEEIEATTPRNNLDGASLEELVGDQTAGWLRDAQHTTEFETLFAQLTKLVGRPTAVKALTTLDSEYQQSTKAGVRVEEFGNGPVEEINASVPVSQPTNPQGGNHGLQAEGQVPAQTTEAVSPQAAAPLGGVRRPAAVGPALPSVKSLAATPAALDDLLPREYASALRQLVARADVSNEQIKQTLAADLGQDKADTVWASLEAEEGNAPRLTNDVASRGEQEDNTPQESDDAATDEPLDVFGDMPASLDSFGEGKTILTPWYARGDKQAQHAAVIKAEADEEMGKNRLMLGQIDSNAQSVKAGTALENAHDYANQNGLTLEQRAALLREAGVAVSAKPTSEEVNRALHELVREVGEVHPIDQYDSATFERIKSKPGQEKRGFALLLADGSAQSFNAVSMVMEERKLSGWDAVDGLDRPHTVARLFSSALSRLLADPRIAPGASSRGMTFRDDMPVMVANREGPELVWGDLQYLAESPSMSGALSKAVKAGAMELTDALQAQKRISSIVERIYDLTHFDGTDGTRDEVLATSNARVAQARMAIGKLRKLGAVDQEMVTPRGEALQAAVAQAEKRARSYVAQLETLAEKAQRGAVDEKGFDIFDGQSEQEAAAFDREAKNYELDTGASKRAATQEQLLKDAGAAEARRAEKLRQAAVQLGLVDKDFYPATADVGIGNFTPKDAKPFGLDRAQKLSDRATKFIGWAGDKSRNLPVYQAWQAFGRSNPGTFNATSGYTALDVVYALPKKEVSTTMASLRPATSAGATVLLDTREVGAQANMESKRKHVMNTKAAQLGAALRAIGYTSTDDVTWRPTVSLVQHAQQATKAWSKDGKRYHNPAGKYVAPAMDAEQALRDELEGNSAKLDTLRTQLDAVDTSSLGEAQKATARSAIIERMVALEALQDDLTRDPAPRGEEPAAVPKVKNMAAARATRWKPDNTRHTALGFVAYSGGIDPASAGAADLLHAARLIYNDTRSGSNVNVAGKPLFRAGGMTVDDALTLLANSEYPHAAGASIAEFVSKVGDGDWFSHRGYEAQAAREAHYSLYESDPTYQATPEQQKAALDYLASILPERIKREFGNLVGGAGMFDAKAGILLSVHALNPTTAAAHEAMHAFFVELQQASPDTAAALIRWASHPRTVAALHAKLSGDSASAARLQLEDPLERAAYAFQFYVADPKFALPPAAQGFFGKLYGWMRAALKYLGLSTDAARAQAAMEALHSGAWARDSVATMALLDAMSHEGKLSDVKAFLDPIVIKPLQKFLTSQTDRLRKTGVPALSQLADLLYAEHGVTGAKYREGYIQEVHRKHGEYAHKLGTLLDTLSEEQVKTKLTDALRGVATGDAKVEKVAQNIHGLLRDLLNAMHKEGCEIGDLGENYFPQVYNLDELQQKRPQVIALFQQGGVKDPEGTYRAIMESGDIEGVSGKGVEYNAQSVNAATPGMSLSRQRTVPAALTPELQKLGVLDNDAVSILNKYIHAAVKRAAYAKRFGDDTGRLQALLDQAKEQGASRDMVAMAIRAVSGMQGTLGADISPQMRKSQAAVVMYENLRVLTTGILSQLPDVVGIAIKSGRPTDALKAVARAVTEAGGYWKEGVLGKERTKQDYWEQVARATGVIENHYLTNMAANLTGTSWTEGQLGAGDKKWLNLRWLNDKFFAATLMTGWNNSNRAIATQLAAGRIAEWAQTKQGDKNFAYAQRNLADLGLNAADVLFDASGRPMLTAAEILAKGGTAEQAEKMGAALHRWVDGAVLRPHAGHRPGWMNDPHFMIFAHLKQFMWTQQKTILQHVKVEAQQGNYAPLATGALMYMAAGMFTVYLRALAKGGGELPEWLRNKSVADKIMLGIDRSGMLGVRGLVMDTERDWSRGELLSGSLLGPAAKHVTDSVRNIAEGEVDNLVFGALPTQDAWSQFVLPRTDRVLNAINPLHRR